MNLPTGAIRAIQHTESFNHSDLARLGFVRTERTASFLANPALAAVPPALVRAMGAAPDPDEAVIALLRLAEAAAAAGHTPMLERILTGGEQAATAGESRTGWEHTAESSAGAKLVQLLGSSAALGDFLTRHPDRLTLLEEPEIPPENYRDRLLRAVDADPTADMPISSMSGSEGRAAIRVEYHDLLCRIAVLDLMAEDPAAVQPEVSRRISALAGAALDAALALARTNVQGQERVRFAVIAMGKTGAQELNYNSDVDVMYVVAPAVADTAAGDDSAPGEPAAESELARIGGLIARELARICSERTSEGTLWQVDPNLRPEGKDGELVRTLESYRTYYQRWAKSWEFQALLKARCAAGDQALGRAFEELTAPMVWQASSREGFVEDARAMRRRVVALIPKADADHNLKLGPGGLRDVEFTIQLLQMVHGRTDESIRARSTLGALRQLTDGGYVSRDQSAELDHAYRWERALEHRIQLQRLRRSHLIPTGAGDTRRLARAMRMSEADFTRAVERTRRRVRRLHEEIYYRPLLQVCAGLTDGEVALSPDAATARLAAIGYRDPRRAMQHIDALTRGMSRRAAIQRQLLPSLLEWFADGIDPDLGLLAFRRLSDALGSTHWFLGMLRDSGLAAKHLTRVLSSSTYIGNQLETVPGAVRWLSRSSDLVPLTQEKLANELYATTGRAPSPDIMIQTIRDTRTREITRIALAHITGAITPAQAAAALTDLAIAVIRSAMDVARTMTAEEGDEHAACVPVAVLAMGSFGAAEMGYSSDADVQFLVAAPNGVEDSVAVQSATRVVSTVQKILNAPSSGIDMRVNADLRPEGRSGPMVRTLDSFADYYTHHAQLWEKQALLRSSVVISEGDLAERITQIIDPVRYPEHGLDAAGERSLARMKARIESERLPRATRAAHHLKLGPGAMTDVEWVVQKLQLTHAHQHPSLRTTSTLGALAAAADVDLLSRSDADVLADAWRLAWQLRRALFLWKGRERDVLPGDPQELQALAVLVAGDMTSSRELMERYRKLTRRARTITERELFGE